MAAKVGARLLALFTMLLIQVAGSTSGNAQAVYPTHSVRLIVSFPAGSTTDILGRLLADQLSKKWKVPVVVENIAGAAGQIGTGRVARADSDGYTLIVSPPRPTCHTQSPLQEFELRSHSTRANRPSCTGPLWPYGTQRSRPRIIEGFYRLRQVTPRKAYLRLAGCWIHFAPHHQAF